MPKIVALPPMTEDPAGDDLLPIHNTSTGDTEKVSIADITGSLNSGWIAVADTWEYSSWTSGTRIGVITIPAGGTSLYGEGMRIRITQTTGGTKYGIIVKVTSTELTVYFGTEYTLNNETITLPAYSQNKAPLGFPLDPAKWTITVITTAERSRANTAYGSMTDTITVPIGAWELSASVYIRGEQSGGTALNNYGFALSTSTSSASDAALEAYVGFTGPNATIRNLATVFVKSYINLAAETTYTTIGKASVGTIYLANGTKNGYLRAICSYL